MLQTGNGVIPNEVTRVLKTPAMIEAAWALKQQPVTVTADYCPRSAGGRHDFYSEGDYWWPDPQHPDSPYIQRDGVTNPDNFTAHRKAMIRLSQIIGALATAYQLTGDEQYIRPALQHCKAWFVDTATRMNPNLLYAQAIKGRATGRGIGIIDAIQLMEVTQGLETMATAKSMDQTLLTQIKSWFNQYLQWLTTHPYGRDEMNAANNHGTCWTMQAAAFAHFTGDENLMNFCKQRYKQTLLPGQMATDGSFPLELKRTKPYGYSLFNLDAMATICQLLSTPQDDLWHYQTADGRSIEKGITFLVPYIKEKAKWPYAHDVMYWEQWPVAQPALLFGANAFHREDWLQLWSRLNHTPDNPEVIRNLPVRHPLLFIPSTPQIDLPHVMRDAEAQTKLMLRELSTANHAVDSPFSPRTIENGKLKLVTSRDWTSGFFPGELWMLYQYTGKEEWMKEARAYTARMEREKTNGGTHDMGFKIYCSYGTGYKLTKDEAYKQILITSAKTLSTRFNPRIGSIRSWDHHKELWGFPVIIDNMMNLELLFEATKLTGDSSFYKIAVAHANTVIKNHYRPDYSSYHVVDYDTATGKVVKKQTWQGYADSSAWARGQAWGLYAFTMCYRETHDPRYLNQAEHIAAFLLHHRNLPADKIPYYDFDAPGIPNEPRDASAAAIMASGLYELSHYSIHGNEYHQTADLILESLTNSYRSPVGENHGFILLHSTGGKPYNSEIDVPINYADYYYLEALLRSKADQPTSATSQTPSSDIRMNWWREARFGLFIHWGVYAVPAGVYHDHQIAKASEWIMNRGKIPVTEYQQYAKQFNPTKYDPEAWVKMAKDAGMKYIVITAKHHDGFALFKTNASKWNIVDATPYGKDLLKPLADACRKHGIRLGFYYSQSQDWCNPGGAAIRKVASEGWANPDSTTIDAYTKEHEGHWDPAQTTQTMDHYIDNIAVPQVRELLTQYGDVAVLWWDTPTNITDEEASKLRALLKLQPNIITNDRLRRPDFPGDYKTPEQKIPNLSELDGKDWETCMTMNSSWGYKAADDNWKTPATLIRNLIDIASKGGNYLLNVGPTAEGTFPKGSIDGLRVIGAWMKINGEAIYGTTASPFGILPWGRCTKKGDTYYFFVSDWPKDGKLTVPGWKGTIKKAQMLDGGERIKTSVDTDGLTITVPAKPTNLTSSVIKVESVAF